MGRTCRNTHSPRYWHGSERSDCAGLFSRNSTGNDQRCPRHDLATLDCVWYPSGDERKSCSERCGENCMVSFSCPVNTCWCCNFAFFSLFENFRLRVFQVEVTASTIAVWRRLNSTATRLRSMYRRLQLGSAFIPAVPLVIGVLFCPESPR